MCSAQRCGRDWPTEQTGMAFSISRRDAGVVRWVHGEPGGGGSLAYHAAWTWTSKGTKEPHVAHQVTVLGVRVWSSTHAHQSLAHARVKASRTARDRRATMACDWRLRRLFHRVCMLLAVLDLVVDVLLCDGRVARGGLSTRHAQGQWWRNRLRLPRRTYDP